MASEFKYTNVTNLTTNTVTGYALGLVSNYAVVKDEPDEVILENKTTPLDCEEIITYRGRKIPKVSTSLTVANPAPVKAGVQYQIQVEECLRTTDDTDPDLIIDEPIVAYLTIRHPKSGHITTNVIEKVLKRLLSAIYRDDASSRLDDIMRLALRPTKD